MVDYYARQLPLLLSDIELGLPVQLIIGAQQELAITVADRTVIVSPPRLNQQSAFEQAILSDYCTTHSCASVSSGTSWPDCGSGWTRLKSPTFRKSSRRRLSIS